MISRMLINNYQAHTKLRVDFDPGITTIIGPSDVGKSAIVRALRWVCNNQPGGDAFVRHGSAGASVKLEVDGRTITRRRSPGGETNEYQLDDTVFKAFGRDVPEPIKDLLNMGPTSWQLQHDPPYWFSDTAGEVSRQLNTIVNLGIIDDTLAAVSKSVYSAKARLEAAETTLTETKRESKALAWVPDFAAAVADLEAIDSAYSVAEAQAVQVADLLAKAIKCRIARDIASRAATAAQIAVDAGTKALRLRDRAQTLARLVKEAEDCAAIVKTSPPSAFGIISTHTDYKVAIDGAKALQAILDDIAEKEAILCEAEKNLKIAEKAVPPRCPTCSRSL